VLGALLEKDITTPEYYPLTVNALVNACNQKSSREPIVHYTDDDVLQALALLRNRHMALKISGAGHRVEKYGHSLGETLNLGRRELALLCVLMLRGPQTLGELRGRTERMHDFADLDEVERCLQSLASRDPEPLVKRLPRGRWGHLFGGEPEVAAEPPATASILADGAFPGLPATMPAADRTAFEERITTLEREVEQLKQMFEGFRKQFE